MPYRVNRRRFIGLLIILSAFLWIYVGIRVANLFVQSNAGGANAQLILLEVVLGQIVVVLGCLLLSLEKKE